MGAPSLRFTSVSLLGGLPTSRTEYICGRNTRSESRSCTGHSATTPPTNVQYEYGPLRGHIHNRDLSYGFELDLATRIYTAFRVNEYGSPVWIKPRRVQPVKRSGQTLHVHTETIDTGERREMFAYTARHVITKSRQMRDSQLLSESECDGWYIEPPAAWLSLHPPKPGTFYHVLSFGHGGIDDYKFTETGKRETGFIVLVRRTHKSSYRDETGSLRTHESVHHEEITELSEIPLQSELFVPPRDFRRVPHLPNGIRYSLAHRTRLRWEMLKDSFSLQNRIAKFSAFTPLRS
jgi:hypothetical protein